MSRGGVIRMLFSLLRVLLCVASRAIELCVTVASLAGFILIYLIYRLSSIFLEFGLLKLDAEAEPSLSIPCFGKPTTYILINVLEVRGH